MSTLHPVKNSSMAASQCPPDLVQRRRLPAQLRLMLREKVHLTARPSLAAVWGGEHLDGGLNTSSVTLCFSYYTAAFWMWDTRLILQKKVSNSKHQNDCTDNMFPKIPLRAFIRLNVPRSPCAFLGWTMKTHHVVIDVKWHEAGVFIWIGRGRSRAHNE